MPRINVTLHALVDEFVNSSPWPEANLTTCIAREQVTCQPPCLPKTVTLTRPPRLALQPVANLTHTHRLTCRPARMPSAVHDGTSRMLRKISRGE